MRLLRSFYLLGPFNKQRVALCVVNEDTLRLEVTVHRLPLYCLLIVMVRHCHRVLLPECDLLGFAVGPSLLQCSLFLFNQINQGEHERHLPVNSMPRGEELFKSERR